MYTQNDFSVGSKAIKEEFEKIKKEIINILISNQGTCKIGSDGDYSTELCVFSDDYDFVANQVALFIQSITDKENQPNQFGIVI